MGNQINVNKKLTIVCNMYNQDMKITKSLPEKLSMIRNIILFTYSVHTVTH